MDKYDEFFEKLKAAEPSNYGTEPASQALYLKLTKDHVAIATTYVYPTKLTIAMCIAFIERYATYPGDLIPGIEHSFFYSVPIMIYATDETSIDRSLVWDNGAVQYTAEDHIILWISEELVEIIRPTTENADE